MRTAARLDANQPEVVKALEAFGCTVLSLAQLGHGVPDLLWGKNGRMGLIEVKDGTRPACDRRLNPKQLEWHAWWRGGPVATVTDIDGAIRAVKVGCA
jgi:hypothetical protein